MPLCCWKTNWRAPVTPKMKKRQRKILIKCSLIEQVTLHWLGRVEEMKKCHPKCDGTLEICQSVTRPWKFAMAYARWKVTKTCFVHNKKQNVCKNWRGVLMVGYGDLITRNEIRTTLAIVTYLRTCIGYKTGQKFFVFLLLWFSSRVKW